MERPVVICLSVGTCVLVMFVTGILAIAIVVGGSAAQPTEPSARPFQPRTGVMGEMHRLKNEMDFGPVNLDAAKEVKSGGLLARIRQNRQSRVCAPCPAPQSVQVVSACHFDTPVQYVQPSKPIVIDPYDCNYSYFVANSPPQSIVVQPSGLPALEMPSVAPTLPISKVLQDDCPTCKKDPRTEKKTGSFICSNCRKPQVGNWHTDWNDDGQPTTFLCESCYSIMSPDQREKAYRGYIARQMKSVGGIGLLHPELGK